MKYLKQLIGILLFHANRNPFFVSKDKFYQTKDRILKKHGHHFGYDVQNIEGKECYSCSATGVHKKYDWQTGKVYRIEECYKCDGTGWYKFPKFVVLEKWTVGGYNFHLPKRSFYTKEKAEEYIKEQGGTIKNNIQGYIQHGKYNRNLATLFWLIFEPKFYLNHRIDGLTYANSYHFNWWKPYSFINNIFLAFNNWKFFKKCFKEQVQQTIKRNIRKLPRLYAYCYPEPKLEPQLIYYLDCPYEWAEFNEYERDFTGDDLPF